MSSSSPLGKLLKVAREKKGLKSKDICESLGTYPPIYSNWETGKRIPERTSLDKLIVLLDLNQEVAIKAWIASKQPEAFGLFEGESNRLKTEVDEDDLKFLISVLAGLKKPLTIAMVIDLITRRKSV